MISTSCGATPPVIFVSVLLACTLRFCVGCGSPKPVSNCVPAYGTVTVDGQPESGVLLTLQPIGGGPAVAQAVSDADGEFVFSTYEQGDGAIPGQYHVTCVWGAYNAMSRSFEGDRLGGKYADPQSSSIRWDLSADESSASKRIELTTH